MKYDLDKYKFYVSGNKVIAVSTYAKKIVKGYAKCDPRDEFDLEFGKKLAAARCAYKIAEKRRKRAIIEYNKSVVEAGKAMERFGEMRQYFMDSVDQLDDIIEEIEKLTGVVIE